MSGNTIQQTATVRVGDPSGDGASLSSHFELAGAQGGAGEAMEELDSAGDGDLSTARITGDSLPAVNRKEEVVSVCERDWVGIGTRNSRAAQ